ncbi:hypothetical protein N665_0244s0018 [Sinapis alba]|nr:hypothetical protein N665_0244s0018 [Sinapis alba]
MTLFSSTDVLASTPSAPDVKAAYWYPYEETVVRDGGKKLSADLIDTSLFTHLFYSNAELNYVTPKITVSSDFAKFTETVHKEKEKEVEILLSLRIKNADDCTAFGLMIHDPKTRKSLIEESIAVARGLGFAGLDLDWEYPSNDVEMKDFGLLLKEWRSAFEDESETTKLRRLRLTAAVFYTPEYKTIRYDVNVIAESVDWVNLIFYDFYQPASSLVTGPSAALFVPFNQQAPSGSSGLNEWIRSGLPPNKAVFGFSYAGWAWTLEDVNNHGYGAPTKGPAISSNGFITYTDIKKYIEDNGAATFHDIEVVGDYCYAGTTWIGYDDNQSIVEKVTYANRNGLRGYFGWHVGADHNCGLSRAANRAWDAAQPTTTTSE